MKEKKIKTYKIESGLKVPPPAVRPGTGVSLAVVTMGQMKVGDSFLVRDPMDGVRAEKQMRDLMSRERSGDGKRKFVSRRLKLGVRIWRVN